MNVGQIEGILETTWAQKITRQQCCRWRGYGLEVGAQFFLRQLDFIRKKGYSDPIFQGSSVLFRC